MKIKKLLTSAALVCFAAQLSAGTGKLAVDEVVRKANNAAYYGGDDGRSAVRMTIKDKLGRVREREFTILRKDESDGGKQYFYVYFRKPSDVRKMVFIVWKNIDKGDDRWLYLPALDLVKRIAASDKRTSFAGSDYMYEDVSGRGLGEDSHELLEGTDTRYIINNRPKDADAVEFSSYKVWIDKQNFVPMKTEYLDKSGELYRTVEALSVENIDDIPTVVKARVTNHISGSVTSLEFKNIKYNIGLKKSVFTERYLRRPPREARK
ncbi:MAG: outer membrane lipoprotein-sorting protein [Elusimicrobiota bacterium]|nr:outer membrane lipoprotein-sorting protein [Elusimicrobiota bacterium]